MSAAAAAKQLGVKPSTLYSYVSRGWLQSLPGPDGRSRCYAAAEVEALRTRAEATRGHKAVAAGAVQWGQPIIDTAISAITAEGPLYRGVLATRLCSEPFHRVADRLADHAHAWEPAQVLPDIDRAVALAAPPGERLHSRLVQLAAGLQGGAPAALLQLFAVACAPSPQAAWQAAAHTAPAEILAAALGTEAVPALNTALVLCADHELNASTFAARVAASTGASLPMAVCAGLAALSGPLHGALSAQITALLDRIEVAGDASIVLDSVLDAEEVVPGCGHRLYPDGDPRAHVLISAQAPDPLVAALLDDIEALGLPAPSLDLGLVSLCRALRLPAGSPMAVFAVGRTAGWLAHAREQRQRGALIRPRARYTGPT